MLVWPSYFCRIATVAGLLGFLGLTAVSAGIAKMLFYIFALLFVVTLIYVHQTHLLTGL